MKNKKIKIGHTFTALSPEILIFLSQIFLVICLYLVFVRHSADWYATTLVVSSTLALFNLAILYNSLRPWKFTREVLYGEQSNAWSEPALFAFFMLTCITGTIILPGVLLVGTAYAAAQLMLVCGCGWALIIIIGTFFGRKNKGLQRPLRGPFRVWHLSIMLYAAMIYFTWHIADWNPTLRHYTAELTVTDVKGIEGVSEQDHCVADVGTYPEALKKPKCRVRFFCGGRKLFGHLGLGAIKCKYSHQGDSFYISGADPVSDDGDPALRINTKKKLLHYSEHYSLNRRIELKAEITDIKPFTPFFWKISNETSF